MSKHECPARAKPAKQKDSQTCAQVARIPRRKTLKNARRTNDEKIVHPFWITLIKLPRRTLVLAARGYQLAISPLLGQRCRFHPTCSQYFIEAVTKYGAIRGCWRGIRRICRCHPWSPGGYDPP